jgi:hypothetical protein
MGRPCKELHLSPSHLRSLVELSTQAKSLGCCDVVLRTLLRVGIGRYVIAHFLHFARKNRFTLFVSFRRQRMIFWKNHALAPKAYDDPGDSSA